MFGLSVIFVHIYLLENNVQKLASSEVGFIDGGGSRFMLKEHRQIPLPIVSHDKELNKKGCLILTS